MTLVFSIGHSNHDWGTFKRLLETANIGTVADVRSSPASQIRRHYQSITPERDDDPWQLDMFGKHPPF